MNEFMANDLATNFFITNGYPSEWSFYVSNFCVTNSLSDPKGFWVHETTHLSVLTYVLLIGGSLILGYCIRLWFEHKHNSKHNL